VLLAAQLKDIVRRVPAGPVAQLRKVTLWLSPPYPNKEPRATYHLSESWMRQNGRNLAMLKSVEFANVFIFEKESNRMPGFVLHELSHAYHDQVLGWEHAGLAAVYARAMAGRSNDCVERKREPERPSTFGPAYAMTDVGEYFAENSEALFSRNDFYPFTREELGKHDPGMLALLQQVWQVPTTTPPTPPMTPTAPPVSAAFDARCYYRLTTLWQGDGMSLDILYDGKANNVPILARSGNYDGQFWKLTPEANGFYRLTTQAQGDALSLDSVNDSTANNIPILSKTGCNDSGQLWKVTPIDPAP
jgi:hypothetical protein